MCILTVMHVQSGVNAVYEGCGMSLQTLSMGSLGGGVVPEGSYGLLPLLILDLILLKNETWLR